MKKLILAILAAGTITSAQAQKPGSILLYGNVGVATETQVDDDGIPGTRDVTTKAIMWNFNPGIGFQFNRNWTAGINFGIGGWAAKQDNFDTTTGSSFDYVERQRNLEVGPFLRYTMPIGRTFYFFDQINLSYLNQRHTWENPAPASDVVDVANGFSATMMPAFGINVSHCIALNFGIGGVGYQTLNWDHDGPSSTRVNDFFVTFGQQFNVGISASLGGYHHRGHMEPGMDHRHMDASDDDDAPRKKSRDDDDE